MIRIINSSNKLQVGSLVITKKKYENGSVVLPAGAKGEVIGIEKSDFPDMNLFNLKVINLRFGEHEFALGEEVFREYMEKL